MRTRRHLSGVIRSSVARATASKVLEPLMLASFKCIAVEVRLQLYSDLSVTSPGTGLRPQIRNTSNKDRPRLQT